MDPIQSDEYMAPMGCFQDIRYLILRARVAARKALRHHVWQRARQAIWQRRQAKGRAQETVGLRTTQESCKGPFKNMRYLCNTLHARTCSKELSPWVAHIRVNP